ncbi:MAG TPA: Ppx/GppA phosphatase family protein [Stenomitos sp.]
MKTLAAIDCGSNSFHLLIVRVDAEHHTWETIAKDKEMVRLASRDFAQTQLLSDEAVQRGVEALKRFKKLADQHGADRIVAVATSAVREAKNAETFLKRAEEEAGIAVEPISGTEEARLIYLGVTTAVNFRGRKAAIVDIGGASTELVIGTPTELLFARSLKIGAVRLYEQFLKEDPLPAEAYYRLIAHVKGILHQLVPVMREVGYDFLIATSGTALTLGEIDAAQYGKPPKGMNGYKLSRDRLHALEQRLRQLPMKERQKIEGLPPRRADIIVSGAGILSTIMDELDMPQLVLCDRALREGIVLDALYREGILEDAAHIHDNVRSRAIRATGERFGYDAAHGEHVAQLALSLFDQTESLHGLPRSYRDLLEGAALLHDVGFHINHSSHHKHSYYLIRHAELLGFHEPEIELMANVARYHRKSLPKDKHLNFKALTPQQREAAGKLIALLRVADALDHSGMQVVKDVSVRLEGPETVFFVQADDSCDVETWGALEKADAWSKYMGTQVRFVQVPVVRGAGGTGPLTLPHMAHEPVRRA